jgi:GNAT superfamily N-acetyltransferase
MRDSAFDHPPLSILQRLTRRRRDRAEVGRYPHLLTRRECWTVRAEVDGELIGYAWGHVVSDDHRWAYIDDVAVHADRQGRGVGRALIDNMVGWFQESGIIEVTGLPIDGRMAQVFAHHGITARPRNLK